MQLFPVKLHHNKIIPSYCLPPVVGSARAYVSTAGTVINGEGEFNSWLSPINLEAVPNMCQVRKNGEPVFVIYPHYPGYSISKEYPNLATIGMMGKNKDIPVFTVSNDKFQKFLVDAPVAFELIIDVSQKAKVQLDVDLFLETMSPSKQGNIHN